MLERVRLGGFSGTYRLRNSELARDRKKSNVNVTVIFLDDTVHVFHIEKRSKGSELLELVFQHMELTERDYFGLHFAHQPSEVVRWVDPNKVFLKQWSNVKEANETNPTIHFRVKFFVTDPSRLQEEYTRYQFYLQIKRDIFHGKLTCSLNTACLLASYTVQAELGDFNPIEHTTGYLSELHLLNEQSEEIERRISELHKLHRGQLPADAEYNYLEHAKRLDMYGVDLHNAKDSAGKDINLGVNSLGLHVYQNNIRVNTFSWTKMVKVSFKRKDFFIQLRREPSEVYDTLVGFCMGSHRNAKVLWKSCVEHHSFFRLQRPHRSHRFLPLTLGSKFYYSGRTELQAVQESKQRPKISKTFIRSPVKKLIASPINGSSDGNGKAKGARSFDNKVTSKPIATMPMEAWGQNNDDDRYIEHCLIRSYDPINIPPLYSNNTENPNVLNEEGVVTIRLSIDEQGRFGFNVKGGVDDSLPVFVSRVAPHTPADRSIPKVCEGDQVLMINGRDVNEMKHDQIVNLIRAAREYRNGELILTIRQNALVKISEEEPLYQYVPESGFLQNLDEDAHFTQSLLLLSDGLASGALLTQYEQQYRKNPDLTITDAKKPENISKNRYRDISPYDITRVVLLNADSGDYINANYVDMKIPGGVINRYIATQGPLTNTTCDFWRMVQQESSRLIVMLTTVMERGRPKCHQYWPMADEEIELTAGFSIKCLKEQPDETGSFVFRELLLCDKKTDEKRVIKHLQYLVWPDHGVPSDPNLFLEFTEHVREIRSNILLEGIDTGLDKVKLIDADSDESGNFIIGERKSVSIDPDKIDSSPDETDTKPSTSVYQFISSSNPPVIVHCSAGIGRTGVLILMDTALELMKVKEPIYPLDIVRTMRDQRPCMVQNVSQYRFVCESICAAYNKLSKNILISDSSKTI